MALHETSVERGLVFTPTAPQDFAPQNFDDDPAEKSPWKLEQMEASLFFSHL